MVINYTSSYKALNRYINQYNDAASCKKEMIEGSAYHTAKEIIRIYGAFLCKAEYKAGKLPYLPTNNKQLAVITLN